MVFPAINLHFPMVYIVITRGYHLHFPMVFLWFPMESTFFSLTYDLGNLPLTPPGDSARHRQDPPGAFQEDVGREDIQFQARQALSFQQIPYFFTGNFGNTICVNNNVLIIMC